MCTEACLDYGKKHLTEEDIKDKHVIEVGSMDVNGSLRPIAEAHGPRGYIGVDVAEGPGVDEICSVHDLVNRFGEESFDLVISSEMIEHVQDWRLAISQMKAILKPGGAILITTRSYPFPYHEYPYDYWRFELDDMRAIFSDMRIESLEPDEGAPGVLVKARKPADFVEKDLSRHALYSMVARRRTVEIEFSKMQYFATGVRNSFLARKMRGAKRRLFSRT